MCSQFDKSRWSQCLCFAVAAVMFAGCGSDGPQGGPRVKTIPLKGLVKVDGTAASFLRVIANPSNGAGALPVSPAALTNSEGKFELSSYESGDGVPPGDYVLTFEWGEMNLMNGQYSGDHFKGKYADPAKSEIKVSVADSDEVKDVGTIELSLK